MSSLGSPVEDLRHRAQAAIADVPAEHVDLREPSRPWLGEVETRLEDSAGRLAPVAPLAPLAPLAPRLPPPTPAIRDAAAAPIEVVVAPDSEAFDELDGAFDGNRRRRRAMIALTVFVVLVLGGVLGALALSRL